MKVWPRYRKAAVNLAYAAGCYVILRVAFAMPWSKPVIMAVGIMTLAGEVFFGLRFLKELIKIHIRKGG